MDSQRLFLYMGLMFLCLLIYQAWVIDYSPRPVTESSGTSGDAAVNAISGTGAGSSADTSAIPSANTDQLTAGSGDLPAANNTGTTTAATGSAPAIAEVASAAESRISVKTDVVDATVSSVGGTILGINLLKYPVSLEQQEDPFVLGSDSQERFLVAQSGLLAVGDTTDAPTHRANFTAEKTEYVLQDGVDSLQVPMVWQSEDGVKVTKTLTFTRDSYEVLVDYKVENNSAAPWRVNQYQQLLRKPVTKDETQKFLYTYIGGVVSSPEKRYEKVKFDDFQSEPLSMTSDGGWIAMIQHYFAAAWIPSQEETNKFYTKYVSASNRYLIGMISGNKEVAAGSTGTLSTKAFIGPKVQDRLAASAAHLDLTVDYGWLHILAKPLFWLLNKIHSVIGNWGWAIIILTCMIKGVFYKLSKASYTSMARMKKLQPQLASLKERYGDDRAKMGQETMALYKKEKVNPLGGCLPMLVQIPVFIALYWMLLESVELRQAPWIGWIQDLSIKDPFFILPFIMGATMFIQQRLNPAPVDPIQAKVFMALPVVFTVFFAFFPAGLVLYWCVNNTLSIAQQYYITRHVIGDK